MASVNKVILVGNLGRDPEIRFTAPTPTNEKGLAIASFSLATTRRYRGSDGQFTEETEWHRISLFGRLAEIARDYLHKGSAAYIEGRLRTRKYTDKDNIERYTTEIVGEQLQLLDRRSADQSNVDQAVGQAAQTRAAAPATHAGTAPAAAPAANSGIDDEVPF